MQMSPVCPSSSSGSHWRRMHDPQILDDDVDRHNGPVLDVLLEGEVDGEAIEEKKITS